MITLKLNVALHGKKAGEKLLLATDSESNIIDSFWARRLKDSKIDNCVEIVQEKKSNNKRDKA